MEEKVRTVYADFDKKRKEFEAKEEDLKELEEIEKLIENEQNNEK